MKRYIKRVAKTFDNPWQFRYFRLDIIVEVTSNKFNLTIRVPYI